MRSRARQATTSDSDVLADSRRSIRELSELASQIKQHQEMVKAELAALSFMTLVIASDAVGKRETFVKLGGESGIRLAVVMLYERVMSDSVLAPYFDGANMLTIRQRQVDMFLALFGVADYAGDSLAVVHQHLHVTSDAFARLMYHINAVLTYYGVPASEATVFVGRLRRFESEIVNP